MRIGFICVLIEYDDGFYVEGKRKREIKGVVVFWF